MALLHDLFESVWICHEGLYCVHRLGTGTCHQRQRAKHSESCDHVRSLELSRRVLSGAEGTHTVYEVAQLFRRLDVGP